VKARSAIPSYSNSMKTTFCWISVVVKLLKGMSSNVPLGGNIHFSAFYFIGEQYLF